MTKPQTIGVTEPVNEELPQEKFDELNKFIDNMETTKGALIEILHKAQDISVIFRGCPVAYSKKTGYTGCRSICG